MALSPSKKEKSSDFKATREFTLSQFKRTHHTIVRHYQERIAINRYKYPAEAAKWERKLEEWKELVEEHYLNPVADVLKKNK